MPAPDAAETIFDCVAESTLHGVEHWCVGAVPVVPFCAVKPAPELLSVSEFAASAAPLVAYEFAGTAPQGLALLQYSLNTVLLPAEESPITLTFQPEPLPLPSEIEKLDIWAFLVWDWPFSVRLGRSGTSGAVPNASVPAVTANCVVSFAVAALARGAHTSRAAVATAA